MATIVLTTQLATLILMVAVSDGKPCVSAKASLDKTGRHVIISEGKPSGDAIAWGSFNDSIENTGYALIENDDFGVLREGKGYCCSEFN